MPTLAFRRHDPWWGVDGAAAQRRYRYQRFVSLVAFTAACTALAGAGMAWAVHLGFAALLGIHVPYVI
jgi:hypothetical protein